MAKWTVEYVIGTAYTVTIEADSPAEAAEIFEARYTADETDMEIHDQRHGDVTHMVTHIGHA